MIKANVVIVTIHGIRKGDKMKKLREKLAIDFPEHIIEKIDYGYLRAFINYFPIMRTNVSKYVASRLETIKYKYPSKRVVVVAHSNGTWAIGRATEKNNPMRFRINGIILLGSVLKRNFDWGKFPFIKVINFISTNDKVVFLSKPFYFMGWSGRYGFKKKPLNLEQIYVKWGHSGFLKQYEKIRNVVSRNF